MAAASCGSGCQGVLARGTFLMFGGEGRKHTGGAIPVMAAAGAGAGAATTLWLVRHGERFDTVRPADWAALGLPNSHIPLTERGERQAFVRARRGSRRRPARRCGWPRAWA